MPATATGPDLHNSRAKIHGHRRVRHSRINRHVGEESLHQCFALLLDRRGISLAREEIGRMDGGHQYCSFDRTCCLAAQRQAPTVGLARHEPLADLRSFACLWESATQVS